MLIPKKTKYRKVQRGNMKGVSKGARTIAFGTYGLEAVEPHGLQLNKLKLSVLQFHVN